jgi:hypothetical protein
MPTTNRRHLPPSLRLARTACAAGLALAAACAELPTEAGPVAASAAAPVRSVTPASGFTGGFDVDPANTLCEWDANLVANCRFRVIGIGGVPVGARLVVRLEHRYDVTFRCQNVRNGRVGRPRTLLGQVASIASEFSAGATEFASTLGTSPLVPVDGCNRNESAVDLAYVPQSATLLFGYVLDGRFFVNSASVFSPAP